MYFTKCTELILILIDILYISFRTCHCNVMYKSISDWCIGDTQSSVHVSTTGECVIRCFSEDTCIAANVLSDSTNVTCVCMSSVLQVSSREASKCFVRFWSETPVTYGLEEIAHMKPAQQSSTFDSHAVPGNAVDGNTDGNYYDGSCSHTLEGLNAWWAVDLQSNARVVEVDTWSRTDCCTERLNNFYIYVSNDSLDPNASQDKETCAFFAGGASQYEEIPCTEFHVGRYLIIHNGGEIALSLCEVKVYADFVLE